MNRKIFMLCRTQQNFKCINIRLFTRSYHKIKSVIVDLLHILIGKSRLILSSLCVCVYNTFLFLFLNKYAEPRNKQTNRKKKEFKMKQITAKQSLQQYKIIESRFIYNKHEPSILMNT